MNQNVTIQKVPLPATKADLLLTRPPLNNLNDLVDQIHLELYDDPEYIALLDAVSDEDAVEGSLAIDNAKAAERIRNYAIDKGMTYVAEKKLATIVRSLSVVLRRWKMSRKERAVQINGEVVPNGE